MIRHIHDGAKYRGPSARTLLRQAVLALALYLPALCGLGGARAQSIDQIAKSDPLIITGAVGTQNTYYHSSMGSNGRAQLSNTLYANLNISFYGINMPFSFYLSNGTASWSYPQFSLSMSPSWHDWTLHLGERSMSFSNYVYNSPFYGVGLEYGGHNIRFGAFYGRLKRAISDDPTDPAARSPQYSRYGWGFKVGYGTGKNYLDLFVFHAKDRIGSIDEYWQNTIVPQENLAIGVKGRVSFLKHFSLTANAATSLFTYDTRAEGVPDSIIGKWGKIFDSKYTSKARFAGDAAMNYSMRYLNLSLQYKYVQPSYSTLGTGYVSNNYTSYGVAANTSMFKGRVTMNGNFSHQRDNLSGEQLYTTKGLVYNGALNWRVANSLNLNAAYNGYQQKQTDGIMMVNDSTRVNRLMHSLTSSANYTFQTDELMHAIGASYNFSKNLDRNKLSRGAGDVKTNAVGANYSLSVEPWEMAFTLGYNYQKSTSNSGDFTTNMLSFSTGRAFLKDKDLRLDASLSYAINEAQGTKTNSFGSFLSSSYAIKEVHQFGLSAGFNHYNQTYTSESGSASSRNWDVNLSLNYNYTFTLLEIKRKAKEQGERKKSRKSKAQ